MEPDGLIGRFMTSTTPWLDSAVIKTEKTITDPVGKRSGKDGKNYKRWSAERMLFTNWTNVGKPKPQAPSAFRWCI